MKKKTLLVSERSAGHVYPALAIAEKIILENPNNDLFFFTSSKIFKKHIKKNGYTVFGLTFSFRNIFIEFSWRVIESVYIILKIRPNQIIGFGGRDSIFLVLFGSIFIDRVFIYEPNAKAGKANRFLYPFVKTVYRGLPPQNKRKKDRIVGIPLLKKVKKIKKEGARQRLNFGQEPVVLCFGGSQGSSFINQNFIKFVSKNKNKPYQIIHLTGKKEYQEILSFYAQVKNNKFIQPFSWEMPLLYSAADLVLARAGALTLANISFYDLASILIPYPEAEGHQSLNAAYLREKGAAVVFLQNNFNFNDFNSCLEKLIWNNSFREKIEQNVKKVDIEKINKDFLSYLSNKAG